MRIKNSAHQTIGLVFRWAIALGVVLVVASTTIDEWSSAGAYASQRLRNERSHPSNPDPLPNIVLLLTDDQRADSIGAYGNVTVRTPNLDRLARDGTKFLNAYSPNPLCVPSRAEILTGRTGFENGIHSPYSNQLDRDLRTLPQRLGDAGYVSWYVGKWHTQGRPSDSGYDECLGLYGGGMGRQAPRQLDFKGMEVTGYRGWVFQSMDGREKFPDDGIGLTPDISERFADAAIAFIERNSDRPYFLHVNFTAPHDPLLFPTGYEDAYAPERIRLPENYQPQHPFNHGNEGGRDEQMLPVPRTEQAVRENLAAYYAVVEHLDREIGRILDALDRSGQRENTIVLFASDHGLALGSHGLMGKQNMYEHTVRVPFIVTGPNIPADHTTGAMVYLRDILPTACQWARLDSTEEVDAQSLVPILEDQHEGRPFVVGYFSDKQRMIRDRDWKLIVYPEIDRLQLFDMQNDPSELHDLAEDPDQQGRIQEMASQLKEWLDQRHDPLVDAWEKEGFDRLRFRP